MSGGPPNTESPWMSYMDDARTVCLHADGAPGLMAAVAINGFGEETLLLVAKDLLGTQGVDMGNPRCSQPTRTGRPCRVQVAERGDRCRIHGDPHQKRPTQDGDADASAE
jgi:hypothetical protein